MIEDAKECALHALLNGGNLNNARSDLRAVIGLSQKLKMAIQKGKSAERRLEAINV